MNLDAALQTFIEEARELLDGMESALLMLDGGGVADSETVNAIFRAAHTIKGSAGLFGLDAIVAFTHRAESVLDRVRAGQLTLDGELPGLLLECGDYIGALVADVAGGSASADPAVGAALSARLDACLGLSPLPHAAIAATETAAPAADAGDWHLSLRFGPDVLRMGMDPLSFLRYLATLGELRGVVTLNSLPAAADMDPETSYLGFEVRLRAATDRQTLEDVFEFVRDDADIVILPPDATDADFAALLEQRGEGDTLRAALQRLGYAPARTEAASVPPLPAVDLPADTSAPAAAGETAAVPAPSQATRPVAAESRAIKVDASKLDHLINLVGELVISGSAITLQAAQSGHSELIESASVMSRLVEAIRDSALKLRMVQIGDTFDRFRRVVRDVAREVGKTVELQVSGGDTELDKSMVDKLGDPLLHLVRNAIDHGLESSQDRQAAGKSGAGRLHLSAHHDSGSIVIEVGDDGRGLDRERIRAKAIERGLIAAEQTLSDRELFMLITEPGFSTAAAVTNLSGRGVGMDVVRRNIEALRGTLEILSEAGQGTTMRLRLPLTMAIIDGFLVRVGDAGFVLPLDLVDECIELPAGSSDSSHCYVDLRGSVLPYLRLRELFELEGARPRRENVVIVNYAGQRAGLVVDELLGEFQTVIKPLGALFRHMRGLVGSTILGSGEVALILDVPTLVHQAVHDENLSLRAGSHVPLLTDTLQ